MVPKSPSGKPARQRRPVLAKTMRKLRILHEKGVEMTSFRVEVEGKAKRIRCIQLVCLIGIIVVFCISLFFHCEGITFFLAIPGVVCVLGLIHCYSKTKKIACPHCKKSVGYLLLDPNYSKKKDSPLFLPKGLPQNVTQCPYCQASWDYSREEQ